ncbi:MAG: alpha/beta hydrolase [Chthoniobacterales bacterium]
MRLLGKILFIIFVIALLTSGATLALFSSWRTQRIAQLDKGSEVALTPSGEIEFARTTVNGPIILVFHAAPGGYDQGLLLGENLGKNGFQILAPSRPGYLRTPLATGLTPEAQADAAANLLDSLGVEKVGVLAFSLGCPAAIQFAVRHPERAWAVVLTSTVLRDYVPSRMYPHSLLGTLILNKTYGDLPSWLLVNEAKHFPERTILRMLSDETNMGEQQKNKIGFAILKDPSQLDWFRKLLYTTAPMDVRQAGFTNDVVQLRALPQLPYNPIKAPLLVINGANDADTPIANLKTVMNRLPSAQLMTVEDSGPMVWLGPNAKAVNDRILAFMQLYAQPAATASAP